MSRTRYAPAPIVVCLVVFVGCVEHPGAGSINAGAALDGTAGTDRASSSISAGIWPSAADAADPSGDIACGSAICAAVPFTGGFITTCCADEATSTCGLAMYGGACLKPVAGDPRCPSFNFRGIIVVPSCCTEQGKCGLDGQMYGMPGCVELAAADAKARAIGVGGEIPKPRACEAAAAVDDDAGI